MHIFFPIGSFFPAQAGGPGNSVYWLATALAGQGVQVTVVATTQGLAKTVPTNTWQETNFGRVQYVSDALLYLPLRHLWRSVGVLRQADVVHLTSLFYPPSFLLAGMALLCRKPIVWSPRGELADAALQYRPWLKRLVIRAFQPLRHQIWFHATSDAETQAICQHFGADVCRVQLPNGILLPPPEPHAPTGRYLLYLGRLHPIKALDHLIDALAQSPEFKQGGWQLLLAGTGTEAYRQQLAHRAERLGLAERLQWLGQVEGRAKQQLLANAHLTIMPSHSENFGNVVLESLAQHTPVVAATGTPWAVLNTHQAGAWVANTPGNLQAAIEEFLTMNDVDYQGYRQRAGKLAQPFDSWQQVSTWVSVYEQVARLPHPPTFTPQPDVWYCRSV